ncbi:hypothetical protein FB451DRAFT_1273528 [Mycena latifolia]|nr:hypothetical protein FB451DRAFT_1273528 [Mycena latifolia]
MSPTLNAVWLASPPPPFPTSSFISTAFCFFLRYSSGAGRTELQSPSLSYERRFQSPIIPNAMEKTPNMNSPVFQLDSDQSLQRSMCERCVKSSVSTSSGGYQWRDVNRAEEPPFQAATGVGLGVGLPVQREYVLSARSDAEDVPPKSPVPASPTPAAMRGFFDALSAFLDTAHGLEFLSTESPVLPSSPPPHESLTGILPHVFAPTTLSPMLFWCPNPPTPETTCPPSLRFRGTPVYRIPSPVLPTGTNKRARSRPTPRRPRTCTAHVEVKSPVFEYHPSSGTTRYARHGWDPAESFNASRGARRPFRRPDPALIPLDVPSLNFEYPEPTPARPMLPWKRVAVHRAPYTPLPRSPALPSTDLGIPRAENHFQQINRFKTEARRRALLRPLFIEPQWTASLQARDRVRTPEEVMESRSDWLAREEEAAVRGRRERRRWRFRPARKEA